MDYPIVLKSAFDQYFEAPLQAWQQFAGHCKAHKFKKGEIIKREHTRECYFYFMIKGSAGVFLWKTNTFVCLDFIFDQEFFTDFMSLITGKPTPLQLVALEDCETLRMPLSDYRMLTQKTVGSILRVISSELSFVAKQQQQIELLTLTAEERYRMLLEKFPDIDERVAQKHIASYLGITPQSLSRVLNRLKADESK